MLAEHRRLKQLFGLLVLTLSPLLASCGISSGDQYFGLSPTNQSLAFRVGNDVFPQSAADAALAAEARSTIVSHHPEWNDKVQAAVRAGEVTLGMTRAQASAAWGLGFSREITPVSYANWVRRDRFWFDSAPVLAALYFVKDSLIAVRSYDATGRPVPMSFGPSGLGYTRPKRANPVMSTHARLELARSICPEWTRPMLCTPEASEIP